jgi:hypothetical protein
LEAAHVGDDLGGAGEAVLGADFSGLGGLGSRVGAGLGVAVGVFCGSTTAEDVASIEGGGSAEGHGGEQECGNSGS